MSEKEIHQLQLEMKALTEAMGDLTKAMKDQQEAIQPMLNIYKMIDSFGIWGTKLLKALILVLTVVSLVLGIVWSLKKK